jgi:hypothetical protein
MEFSVENMSPPSAVCRWWRRQPLGGKRRGSSGIQVRAEDGRMLIVRLATGTKAHHERTPRRGLLAVSVLLHPCVAAVATGGIEPEHQTFPGGRWLGHDIRERDGRCAARVLVRVGHLVQWWVAAVLLLQQLRG